MYAILVYDFGEKRVAKACKFCKRYLNWVQNSVFEGELTEGQLRSVEMGLRGIMHPSEDSVLIYLMREERWMDRRSLGVRKAEPGFMI